MKFQISNLKFQIKESFFEPYNFLSRPTRKPAFTLIELLVVMVLIGILVAIGAPDYLKFRQKIDLKNSLLLTQSSLKKAYSLSRSHSQHYLVRTDFAYNPSTGQNNNFLLIRQCEETDCSSVVTLETVYLEGDTIFSDSEFKIKFEAPHGNLLILDPAGGPAPGDTEITLTLDNKGLSDDLQIYAQSGLVTTDMP